METNYATLVDPERKYPVSYTITQGGKKIKKKTEILGKDMTEKQIKAWHEAETNLIYKEYQEAMDQYHKEVNRVNDRIFDAIESVCGKKFKKDIDKFIIAQGKDGVDTDGAYALVRKPQGGYQDENWGSFKGIWCNQWSTGMEGDSFSGNMYIQLKKNMWLKIGYSC